MPSPKPISWPPSQYWDGDDGDWSSFGLRIGNPEQTVRVLPSTAGQATWAVISQGCLLGEPGTTPSLTCNQSRGGLFDPSQSKSWNSQGNYSLELERNLGYDINATYGRDTVALGFSKDAGGPSLDSQTVTGIATNDYYVGMFGLGDQPTNITNLTDPHPSFLTTMKSKNLIPSLSWAYTAGAPYRLKGVFGSLTLGGFDLSRFVPNNISFNLAPDISRDIIVGLRNITSTNENGSTVSLLPSTIMTFIDSTIPYIYLPLEACLAFEKAFGLTWNSTVEMYWVNDTLHQSLTTSNPNITFQIGDSGAGGATVDIILPYASFDLVAKFPYPYAKNSTRYFPLQRATNESQYTLGRTFLQEAYLITNYEYHNFSVSQAKFQNGLAEDIIPLPSSTNNTSLPNVSRTAIIGVSVGALIILILTFVLLAYCIRRRRYKYPKSSVSVTTEPSPLLRGPNSWTDLKVHEIDNSSLIGLYRELPDNGKAELLDETSPSGSGNDIWELSQPPATIVYELRTHRSSNEYPAMGQMLSAGTTAANCTSKNTSMKSLASIGALRSHPSRIDAAVKSPSPRAKYLTPRSGTPRAPTPLPPPPFSRKPVDLNRTLPPTPISLSPQLSPFVGTFKDRLSTVQRLQTTNAGARAPMTTSASVAMDPSSSSSHSPSPSSNTTSPAQTSAGGISASSATTTSFAHMPSPMPAHTSPPGRFATGEHKCPPLSDSSMDFEIVIPPTWSEKDARAGVGTFGVGARREYANFF